MLISTTPVWSVIAQTTPVPLQPLTFLTNEGDTRLSTPCSLSCKRIPLLKIVQELSQQSSVTLKIGEAWIQKTTMYAFVKERPLHQILKHIATINNLTWAYREVKGERQYTLYQSKQNRKRLLDLQEAGWESVLNDLRTAKEYLLLSPQLRKIKSDGGDPIAQDFTRYPSAVFDIPLLAWLDEDNLRQLRNHESLVLSYNQLPAVAQEGVHLLAQHETHRRQKEYLAARERNPEVNIKPPVSPPNLENTTLRFMLEGEGVNAHLGAFVRGDFGLVQIGYPYRSAEVDSLWYPALFEKTQKQIPPEKRASRIKIREDIQIEARDLGTLLEQLHQKTGLNYFADAYLEPQRYDSTGGANAFHDAGSRLEGVVQNTFTWERRYWQEGAKGQDVLLLRRDWYLLQGESKTEAIFTRLREKIAQHKPLSLEEVAELLLLPSTQRLRLEEALRIDFTLAYANIGLLKFYQPLKPKERRLLCGEGVTSGNLGGTALQSFQSLMRSLNLRGVDSTYTNVRLRLQIGQDESTFVAEVTSSEGGITKSEIASFDFVPEEILEQRKKE